MFHLPAGFSAVVRISHKDCKVPVCSPQRMGWPFKVARETVWLKGELWRTGLIAVQQFPKTVAPSKDPPSSLKKYLLHPAWFLHFVGAQHWLKKAVTIYSVLIKVCLGTK